MHGKHEILKNKPNSEIVQHSTYFISTELCTTLYFVHSSVRLYRNMLSNWKHLVQCTVSSKLNSVKIELLFLLCTIPKHNWKVQTIGKEQHRSSNIEITIKNIATMLFQVSMLYAETA